MGIRLFLVILALLLVFLIVRYLFRQVRTPETKPGNKIGVDMVQCAHCGIHLPKPEAIHDEATFYCCKEHQRLG